MNHDCKDLDLRFNEEALTGSITFTFYNIYGLRAWYDTMRADLKTKGVYSFEVKRTPGCTWTEAKQEVARGPSSTFPLGS